jgi:hypothetical protein
MRYSRVLQRRLDRLESVSPVSSTEDKWNTIHVRALELMSEEDLRSSRRSRRCEIHLRRPGKPQRGPPRPHGMRRQPRLRSPMRMYDSQCRSWISFSRRSRLPRPLPIFVLFSSFNSVLSRHAIHRGGPGEAAQPTNRIEPGNHNAQWDFSAAQHPSWKR